MSENENVIPAKQETIVNSPKAPNPQFINLKDLYAAYGVRQLQKEQLLNQAEQLRQEQIQIIEQIKQLESKSLEDKEQKINK